MLNAQTHFEYYLRLVGKLVEIGLRRPEKVIRGTIQNAMFDSFILSANGSNQIIRFEDVGYIRTVE